MINLHSPRFFGHVWAAARGSVVAGLLVCAPCAYSATESGDASVGQGESLEEVVVTARRREENLQSVPVAISALTESQMETRPALDIADLPQVLSGINSYSIQGIRNNLTFIIRGQGQSYGTNFPSVIPYFAEVPLDRISTGFVYDLENVQVLKGPQGTLFGRNTDGGAVLVVPKAPTNEWGGFGQVKGGNFGFNEYTGAFNAPIVSDKFQLRLAMDIARRQGFTEDLTTGRDADNLHYDSFRATLLLKPFEGFRNSTVYQYYGADENGTGVKLGYVNPAFLTGVFNLFGFPPAQVSAIVAQAQADLARQNSLGPRRTFEDVGGLFSRRLYRVLSNITSYDINENLTIKNIFGLINTQETQQTDFDGSSQPFINIIGSAPFYSSKRMTDELQLQGRSFDKQLTWVTGLYYDKAVPATYVDPTNVEELYVLRVNEPTQFFDTSKAAYAQGTYDLSFLLTGLKVTAGVRYTKDTVTQNLTETLSGNCQAGFPPPSCSLRYGPTDFHAITYNADLEYQFDKDTFVYLANRKGFKSGGFNVTFPSPDLALYNPETLVDEELGIKRDWHFGEMLARTNFDIFHGNYHDIQQTVSVASNGQAFTYVANIPGAIVNGADLDATFVPIAGLTLGLRYTYLNAFYTRTIEAWDINNRFAGTPRNQFTFDAHYSWNLNDLGKVTVGGSYYYQSLVALNNQDKVEHIADEPGYGLLNFDADWHAPFGFRPLDVSLFVNNAADRVYRSGVNDVDGALGIGASWYGAPRMYGISLKYSFGGELK